jgi:hypothetical protein
MQESALAATLRLDDRWSSRVAGGVPAIELAELADVPEGVSRGEALALQDPQGELLGFGLFDPDNAFSWAANAWPSRTSPCASSSAS